MKTVSELIDLIKVDPISEFAFKGESEPVGSPNVFGGQVLAQSLNALYHCVPNDRICHSLHSYFILPGQLDKTIHFEVETIRDGGSFSTRRVLAKQENKVIFFMSASFQLQQDGYEHQIEMPEVPHPDKLISWDDMYQQFKGFLPQSVEAFLAMNRPIEFKPTIINNPLEKKDLPPYAYVWFRVKGKEKLDVALSQSILAYISDYNILTTALQPHASKAHFGNTQMASIDHAMWFHHDFDPHEWLLYAIDTPSTSGARGFTRGNIFTQNGKLVASVSQEGLMRPK